MSSRWNSSGAILDSYEVAEKLSDIALDYGLDDRGFESWQGLGIFLFTTTSRTALGPTQPPIKWVLESLSLGVKRSGREADHSPPSSADVKNAWSYTSVPQYIFMVWCLVKAQGLHLWPFLDNIYVQVCELGWISFMVKGKVVTVFFLTEHNVMKAYWGVEI
jgi:hypothetical protein